MEYDPFEQLVSYWQLTIIEQGLDKASIPDTERKEIEAYLIDPELTQEKANTIIRYLKENETRGRTLDNDFDKLMNRKQ